MDMLTYDRLTDGQVDRRTATVDRLRKKRARDIDRRKGEGKETPSEDSQNVVFLNIENEKNQVYISR